MKKLLFVFFVLAVVMGSTSLHAQNFFLNQMGIEESLFRHHRSEKNSGRAKMCYP